MRGTNGSRAGIGRCLVVACAVLLAGPQAARSTERDAPAEAVEAERPLRSRLVSAERLRELEGKTLAAVERNRARRCLRPVLRGAPLEGPADAKIIAVIEGSRETRACQELLEAESDAIDALLFVPEGEDSGPPRFWRPARPLGDPASRGDLARRVGEACAPVLRQMREAVRHEDACSPYLAGRRGTPRLAPQIRLARAVALAARSHLHEGRSREALELLLDALRFQQDMYRGGAGFLYAMVSVAANGFLVPVLEIALNDARSSGAELLGQVQRELEGLLEAEPHPGEILRGEQEYAALYMFLGGMKGPAWTPPGGWGEERPPARPEGRLADATITVGADERDDLAVAWLAADATAVEWAAACPTTVSMRACEDGMKAVSERLDRKVEDRSQLSRWLGLLGAEDPQEEVLKQVLEILQAGTPAFSKYLRRLGLTVFAYASLRLHAAYRALAESSGRCPGVAAFDAPPLAPLRRHPWDGSPLWIRPVEGAGLLVGSEPVLEPPGERGQPALLVRCPLTD